MLGMLDALVRARPGAIALASEERSWTYAELAARVGEWRGIFERASRVGRRVVGVALPSGGEQAACSMAAFGEDVVVVPLPMRATHHELVHYLEALPFDLIVVPTPKHARLYRELSPSAAVIVADELLTPESVDAALASAPVQRLASLILPQGTWFIQFTSGSTAAPRGIAFTREAWLRNIERAGSLVARPPRALFCVVPQSHAMGAAIVMERVLHGTGVHLTNQFTPDEHFLRMRTHRIELIAAGASYFRMLLQHKLLAHDSLPDFRHVTLGAEPVDKRLLAELWANWPELLVDIRYGVSESVGPLSVLRVRRGDEYVSGDIGEPLCGVELIIGDQPQGLLKVRSESLGTAMVENGQCLALLDDDGWLETSDVGVRQTSGRIRLVGRQSWMIKSHGHRLSPIEVEDVLRETAGVADAVVVSIPEDSGEALVAVVVAQNNCHLDGEALIDHLRLRLSAFKVPKRVEFWAELPRNPAGKLDRRHVIERLSSS